MAHQMQHLMFSLRQQSCRSSLPLPSLSSSKIPAPRFPSLSIHCLRLQPHRTYASKPKPKHSRTPHQPSPQSRHPPPLAPVQPRTTSSPSTKPTTTPAPASPISPLTSTSSSPSATATPTLLYLAPASSTHTLSSLAIATFCTSYGLLNFYDAFLVPHPGLWIAVPYMMGGVSAFMIGVGVWIGLGARRLVGSLSVVTQAAKGLGVEGGRGGRGGGGYVGGGETMIRLEKKRISPLGLGAPKSVDVPLSSVQLSTRMRPLVLSSQSDSPSSSSSSSLYGRLPPRSSPHRRAAIERREADREKTTLGAVLARPFANGLRGLSRWIGRLVGREGFATIWVEGKAWRVDVRNGWFSEDGGALDRVCRVREY